MSYLKSTSTIGLTVSDAVHRTVEPELSNNTSVDFSNETTSLSSSRGGSPSILTRSVNHNYFRFQEQPTKEMIKELNLALRSKEVSPTQVRTRYLGVKHPIAYMMGDVDLSILQQGTRVKTVNDLKKIHSPQPIKNRA